MSLSREAKLEDILSRLKRLIREDRGVSAVEFALIFPFLVLLYLGGLQLLQEIVIGRQVTLTATTLANIVSQYTTISASTQLPDILDASTQIMAPYSPANVTVVVTVITVDNVGKATVRWSQSLNGDAQARGENVTVPQALDIPNATLILSEATYTYEPAINFLNLSPASLSRSIYMIPRASTTINLVP